MSKKREMSRDDARGLVGLIRSADQYFRHPDVEGVIGFEKATRTSMNLEKVAGYLEDHVIDEEGEGLTARDRKTIAGALRTASDLLVKCNEIHFALGAPTMAARLREAASKITRKS